MPKLLVCPVGDSQVASGVQIICRRRDATTTSTATATASTIGSNVLVRYTFPGPLQFQLHFRLPAVLYCPVRWKIVGRLNAGNWRLAIDSGKLACFCAQALGATRYHCVQTTNLLLYWLFTVEEAK